MQSFQQNSCHQNTVRRCTQTLMDVFDVTSSIRNFRAHIFCPRTIQELPENYHKVGPPEQWPTDALSQIDYAKNNPKGILKNLSRGMCMAGWKISPPPPPPMFQKGSATSDIYNFFWQSNPSQRTAIGDLCWLNHRAVHLWEVPYSKGKSLREIFNCRWLVP